MRTDITTETIYVDAILAEKMLENNRWHSVGVKDTNRTISKKTVARYANLMAYGRWLLTHQGLAFREDGSLEDGQHRLLAVIEADKMKPGIVIPFRVTTNVPTGTFKVLDSNLRRSPGNILSSAVGAGNSFQVAATAKKFYCYMNIPFEFATSWASPPQWDSSMLPDVVEQYPCIQEAVSRVRSKQFTGNLTAISTGMALAMELRPDTDVEKFIWRLETGLDPSPGEPAYMLREKLAVMSRMGQTAKADEQLAYFIKAYNKYILGESILAFRFAPVKEGFPRLIAARAEEME